MLRAFASDENCVAFDGNARELRLFRMERASHEELEVVKRATTAPKLDFVVLPLTVSRVCDIEKAIRSKISFNGHRVIVHVQIESDGKRVFGAYDNFDNDAVVVERIIAVELLDQLVSNRTLRLKPSDLRT
jgi:hypothetical protein